ncbi:MAG: PepSY domain-containing protein [Bacteroidota bacterium]
MSVTPTKTNRRFRVLHRYLGFFLAGIMAVYALSGIVLVFRKTNFMKTDVVKERQLAENLSLDEVGKALKIKNIQAERTDGPVTYFAGGQYDGTTGAAEFTKKEYGYILSKMKDLHLASTNDPLYYFNVFFGASLLFFVLSSFWMFRPSTDIFRKGIYFTLGGIVLTLVLLFV